MMRVLRYWAVAGLFVPVLFMLIAQLEGPGRVLYELDSVRLILWPSWIMMGGTYGIEFTALGILVLALSIGINVFLYMAVGAIFWRVYRRLDILG